MSYMYHYRKEHHLCIDCGEIAISGTSRCIGCTQIHQIKQKDKYERLKADGICVECESRKAERGVRCAVCFEKAKERQNRYRKINPRREYRRKEA